MFYVGDFRGKNNVRTAISTDNGASFTFEAGNILGDDSAGGDGNTYVDPDIIKLSDRNYKLYVMKQHKIYSFSSKDALTFTLDPEIRIQPSDFTNPKVTGLYDPEAVLLPDGSIRLFFGATLEDGSWGIVSATSK